MESDLESLWIHREGDPTLLQGHRIGIVCLSDNDGRSGLGKIVAELNLNGAGNIRHLRILNE